jgi:DNA-binding NarL/FixJ family response regulator
MDLVPPSASIVLVEDHAILREGLRALIELESDLRVVGEARSAADAIPLVEKTRPTLVITDLAMPGGESGLQLIARLRALCGSVRVLVLTAYYADEYIRAALHANADGYVLKQACRAELLQAIRAIVAGRRYFSESIASRVVSGYLHRNERACGSSAQLTDREREVLKRIALGESNKRLARALSLSVKTIEKHRANLMRKLGLHNAAAVTLFAVRNGLVPVPGREQHFAQGIH